VGLLTNDRDNTLFDSLSKPNNSIIGKFIAWEKNTAPSLLGLHLFLSAVNLIMDLICICVGAVKLYDRYVYGNFRLNIATVCLSLEVISCLVREIAAILSLRAYIPTMGYISRNRLAFIL